MTIKMKDSTFKPENPKMKLNTLLAWVREILSGREAELTEIQEMPSVSDKAANRLIGRAVGDDDSEDSSDSPDSLDSSEEDKRGCCPYAVKRNIVESLEEIRRFAEKHELAAAVVRALLTLLAEMALGAMKGKVGEKALEALLKAFNYAQHVNDAYLRGKNEAIIREYFPENVEIPHLGGMDKTEEDEDNIFAMAKEA